MKSLLFSSALLFFLAGLGRPALASEKGLTCSSPNFSVYVKTTYENDGRLKYQWISVATHGLSIYSGFVTESPSVNSGAVTYRDGNDVLELEVYKASRMGYLMFMASMPDHVAMTCDPLN